MRSPWRWFALAAAWVLADQVTKWVVLSNFAYGERREVTSFFNLVLVYNKGAAFSMFADAGGWQTPLLVAFALVAAGIVCYLIVRNPGKRMLCFYEAPDAEAVRIAQREAAMPAEAIWACSTIMPAR